MIKFLVVFVLLGISPLALNTTQALPPIITSTVITSTTETQINNSTCQNCNLTTNTVHPIISVSKGPDLGKLNETFTPKGIFSMQNEYKQNMTLSPVGISFFYQNSTTNAFSTGSIWYYYNHNNYEENISIVGTSLTPIIISIMIVCNEPLRVFNFSIACGFEGFIWDKLNQPRFNQTTSTISWNVSGHFNIDPIAIDGTNSGGCASPCTNLGVTLSTSNSNDVIIVYWGGNCGGSNPTTNTVSDTTGLSWTKRLHIFVAGFAGWLDEWYAIAASPLSFDTITVTLHSGLGGCASANMAVNYFGVTGASTSNPFDPNGGLPYHASCSGGGCGVIVDTVTGVTTSNANDMLISGDFNANGAGAMLAGTGFNLLASTPTTGGGETSSQYKIVSSTQSGITVTYSGADSDGFSYLMIVDALQQAANVTLTLIVNPSGSGEIYTNVNGCDTTTTISCSIAISTAIDAFQIPISTNGWQLWLNTSINLVRCNLGQGFPTNPPSNDYQHCNFAAFSIFNNATLQANYTTSSGSISQGSNYGYTAAAVVVLFALALVILVAGIRMKKRRYR